MLYFAGLCVGIKNKESQKSLIFKTLQRIALSDGDPVGIRAQDPQLRRLLLYPAELPDQTSVSFSSAKLVTISQLSKSFANFIVKYTQK